MAKAQVVGGPTDGEEVPIEPFQKSILIYGYGSNWRCPIRNGRIYWNERKKES